MLFELLAVAYEADLTRVFTFMMNREASQVVFPSIGINEPWHHISHHGNDPEKLASLVKINTWHISLFGKFLQRLRDTPDGDGSLLDHSMHAVGQRHERQQLAFGDRRAAAAGRRCGRAPQGQPAPGGAARRRRSPTRCSTWRRSSAPRSIGSASAPGASRCEGQDRGHRHRGTEAPSVPRLRTRIRDAEHERCARASCVCLCSVARSRPRARRRLLDAVKQGDHAAVRQLIEQRVDVNAAEPDGTTALHWAVRADDREMASILLACRRAPVHRQSLRRHAARAWRRSTAARRSSRCCSTPASAPTAPTPKARRR